MGRKNPAWEMAMWLCICIAVVFCLMGIIPGGVIYWVIALFCVGGAGVCYTLAYPTQPS